MERLTVPLLAQVGPRGLEFARYSLDYHIIRNYIQVSRNWPPERAAQHIPAFVRKVVDAYDSDGAVSARLKIKK